MFGEGLGKRWSFEEVRLMTTDGIIDKLASLNIPVNETSFLDVKDHYSAEALAETWLSRHKCRATGFEADFVWMAATVLWERLAPDVINMEIFEETNSICQEFYTQFPDEDRLTLGNSYRAEAESYGRLGDTETTEKKFKDLTDRYPNFAWGYIGWADSYWLDPFDRAAPKDYAKAESIYLKALENPKMEDRPDIIQRLIMLYEEKADLGKADRYSRISEGLQRKIGRNERCPCGSGRKYKKCCGLRR